MIDLRRVGAVALAGVLGLFVLFVMGRCAGAADARVEAAEQAVVEVARRFHVERLRSDSLERVARAAIAGANQLHDPHLRTIARTDSALVALDSASAKARRLAADAAAHEDELRAGLRSIADRADRAEAAFRVERDTAAARLSALLTAQGDLLIAVGAKNTALDAGAELEAKNKKLVDALNAARPGMVHRGFTGLVIGSVTVTCSAGGYMVAGPLGGLAAGAVCAIAAGILSP